MASYGLFSRKMIPAETRYETHDQELLAIIEIFETWRHYLEGCKYKVLVLSYYNNICRFMDTKSLSSWQVRWAKELSKDHFRIDYRQKKANASADALSRFLHRSQAEEKTLRAENSEILHRLQSSLINWILAGLSLSGHTAVTNFFPLHQVLICGPYVLPLICQFWKRLRGELASEGAYQASVGSICLRLPEIYTRRISWRGRSEIKAWKMAGKKTSIECWITWDFLTFQRSSEQNYLAGTITIHWQATLGSTRLEIWSPGNITGHPSKLTLKHTSMLATCA